MPRPRAPGGPAPKERSRKGCWPCKERKVKCDEENKDTPEKRGPCGNCRRLRQVCDFGTRLIWDANRCRQEPNKINFSSNRITVAEGSTPSPRPRLAPMNSPAIPSNFQPSTGPYSQAAFHTPPHQSRASGSSYQSKYGTPSSWSAQSPQDDSPTLPPAYSRPIALSELEGSFSTAMPGTAGIPDYTEDSRPAKRRMISNLNYQNGHSSTSIPVASLLTPSSGPTRFYNYPPSSSGPFEKNQDIYGDQVVYGIDRGIKDRDIPENDDFNALSGSSPDAKRDHARLVVPPSDLLEFGFGFEDDTSEVDKGGYYSSPVEVSIPRSLHPLPAKLLSNKMNLLYFHHFLNHTAKCLLPHNCPSNPFRMVLPAMAIHDENLMNLFLAYSAFHRCILLRQPVPATRIALWMQDVFANLRKALNNPARIITNSTLAAAIMLASLEIISPNAFGVSVPWQSHLDTARQMIVMRGGPKGMRVEGRSDKVSSFLWSWFAYLDVLGSLSGGENSSWLLDYHVEADTDYDIDCVLGFSSKCIRILAKIAALAQTCDRERIQATANEENTTQWQPSKETRIRAAQLELELSESRAAPAAPCTHMQDSGDTVYQWDAVEMGATNDAFHWAGHVHIHRRILGKPSAHRAVQGAVGEIFNSLSRIRVGSNAEGCLLFPMFTAGCDALEEGQRDIILSRMKRIEGLGTCQVRGARTLMEKVWTTGLPWETLVAGEFFG